MSYKSIDSYHDNKCDKETFFDDNLEPKEITGKERLFGMEIEVDFEGGECSNCEGSGRVYEMVTHTCDYCDGTGKVPDDDSEDEDAERDCPDCDGLGYHDVEEEVNCPSCDGRGRWGGDYSDLQDVPSSLEDTFVLEEDGSLDSGFEIITEPMTYNGLTKWLENEWLKEVLDRCDDTGNAGVHIHVTRPDDEMIKKLVLFVNKAGYQMQDLTRESSFARLYDEFSRDTSQMGSFAYNSFLAYLDGMQMTGRRYGSRYDGNFKVNDFLDNAILERGASRAILAERYMILNLTNDATVEFRIFDFTREPSRLQSYVTFLNKVFDMLEEMTYAEVVKADFTLHSLTNIEWSMTVEPYTFEVRSIVHDFTKSRFDRVRTGAFRNHYVATYEEPYNLSSSFITNLSKVQRQTDLKENDVVLLDDKLMDTIDRIASRSDLNDLVYVVNPRNFMIWAQSIKYAREGKLCKIKKIVKNPESCPEKWYYVCAFLNEAGEEFWDLEIHATWIKAIMEVDKVEQLKVYTF